jgi:Lanthionine synthetase C-like protein
MLFDPTRHEALQPIAWDPARVRAGIEGIVRDTEAQATLKGWWPPHPRDLEPADDSSVPYTPLYHGALGVCWALHHLQDLGAATAQHSYLDRAGELLALNRAMLGDQAEAERASLFMGETPFRLWTFGARPDAVTADRLAELIAGNIDHPARELMWGAPGTLLAALFLHERTGQARWAELFRTTAQRLWSQLIWSDEHGCHYWTQDLYGQTSSYIDAVHGFVSVAPPLIRGRALLGEASWAAWAECLANTVSRTATWEDGRASWRPWLASDRPPRMLMQYCHGAPGFVVCLGGFPDERLDALLLAAGEATWAAGPLNKGSNLCHGTGGNGYAFLKLFQRSGDELWLQRARAFAMHGLAQTEAEAQRVGRLRHSLWTGDIGLAIYLWHCLQGSADFPIVDVFYAG